MPPERRIPLVVERRGDAVVVHRPHIVVADVLLARPHNLDGIGDVFGDSDRLFDRVDFEAATEPTAKILVVHRDPLRWQSGELRCDLLRPCRDLRAHPDLAAIRPHGDSRIERFHRACRSSSHPG